jgi:hypothetical protein
MGFLSRRERRLRKLGDWVIEEPAPVPPALLLFHSCFWWLESEPVLKFFEQEEGRRKAGGRQEEMQKAEATSGERPGWMGFLNRRKQSKRRQTGTLAYQALSIFKAPVFLLPFSCSIHAFGG